MNPDLASAALCPVCGGDELVQMNFITPSGFAPDINAKREIDRGQPIVYAGMTDRARLEPQDPPDEWVVSAEGRLRQWTGPRRLVMVNKGVDERGFRVCPDCGRSEPELGPGGKSGKLMKRGVPISHKHPLEQGQMCGGSAEGPFLLGHEFPTDALLLRLRVSAPLRLGASESAGLITPAARMALASLLEALALASSRVLQIDEGELSGWWTPLTGGRLDEAQLYLYDLLPGGAGYARAVGDNLAEVLDATEALLTGCDCPTSCYRCIRHYGNNWIHSSLDRSLALSLLRHLRTGLVPALDPAQKEAALRGLREELRIRGIACELDAVLAGVPVPLLVRAKQGEVAVDVHHPLVDPRVHPTPVILASRPQLSLAESLDAHELVHDLPRALDRLERSVGALA